MTNVDIFFAVWAGVSTGIAWSSFRIVRGARDMLRDVADGHIEVYRDDDNMVRWRKTNGVSK